MTSTTTKNWEWRNRDRTVRRLILQRRRGADEKRTSYKSFMAACAHGYEDLCCRSQFARSPILLPARFASRREILTPGYQTSLLSPIPHSPVTSSISYTYLPRYLVALHLRLPVYPIRHTSSTSLVSPN